MMFGGLGADEQPHGKAAAETPIRSQSRRLRGGEDACIASIIVTADAEPATRPDEEDPVSPDQHEAPELLRAGFAGKHNIRDAGTLAELTALAAGLVGKRLIYCDLIADGGVASGTRARTLLVRAHGAEECVIQVVRPGIAKVRPVSDVPAFRGPQQRRAHWQRSSEGVPR